jgi:hypothetical protein
MGTVARDTRVECRSSLASAVARTAALCDNSSCKDDLLATTLLATTLLATTLGRSK